MGGGVAQLLIRHARAASGARRYVTAAPPAALALILLVLPTNSSYDLTVGPRSLDPTEQTQGLPREALPSAADLTPSPATSRTQGRTSPLFAPYPNVHARRTVEGTCLIRQQVCERARFLSRSSCGFIVLAKPAIAKPANPVSVFSSAHTFAGCALPPCSSRLSGSRRFCPRCDSRTASCAIFRVV